MYILNVSYAYFLPERQITLDWATKKKEKEKMDRVNV